MTVRPNKSMTVDGAHLLVEILPDYPERFSPVAPEVLSAGLLSAGALYG